MSILDFPTASGKERKDLVAKARRAAGMLKAMAARPDDRVYFTNSGTEAVESASAAEARFAVSVAFAVAPGARATTLVVVPRRRSPVSQTVSAEQ